MSKKAKSSQRPSSSRSSRYSEAKPSGGASKTTNVGSAKKFHRPLLKELIPSLVLVFEEKKPASKVLDNVFRHNLRWGSRDRKVFAEVFYEIIRKRYALSYEAQENINASSDILAHYYLKKNDYHVLEAPDLRGLGRGDVKRAPLWIRYSYSERFHEVCQSQMADQLKEYYQASEEVAPVFLRANTHLTSVQDLKRILKEEGIATDKVPASTSALKLRERQNIFKSPAFKKGLFEVQDGGSQLIAPFLQVEPGQRVIDACAGSGGKTLHLATLLKNTGKVLALDIYEWKLGELKKRAKRNSLQNIETRLIEGQKTIKRLVDSADRLLLDVPCTGSGVFRRNPDSKYRWEAEDFERIYNLQKEILNSYSKMLKVGGKMVYSTCSVFHSENQKQVEAFLAENPGWELEETRSIFVGENDFDGFFMARLKRVAAN